MIGSPIYIFYKECEICGWVFVLQSPAAAAMVRGCLPYTAGQLRSTFIPCSCYYSAYSGDGKKTSCKLAADSG